MIPMIKQAQKLLLIIGISMLFAANWSCQQNHSPEVVSEDKSISPQSLVDVNKFLVEKDRQSIIDYSTSKGLKLKETETGLFYAIIKQGRGPMPIENQNVKIAYKLKLIDGTLCYSSDSAGYKVFTVGKGGAEKGLDQGVRLMNKGSRAIFVLPPYLAHGLTGDQICIPARAIIIYEVDLLSIY